MVREGVTGKNNVFVKPNAQSDACIGYGLVRKGRMKSNV